MTDWTAERIGQLRQLRVDGRSASQIAADLGVTRNAVIGKAWRMGLETPEQPKTKKPRVRRKANRGTMFVPVNHQGGRRMTFAIESEPDIDRNLSAADIPIKQRKQVLELRQGDCRWPYGEPGKADFFFCGGHADDGPYCPTHMRVAYVMPQPRWRQR